MLCIVCINFYYAFCVWNIAFIFFSCREICTERESCYIQNVTMGRVYPLERGWGSFWHLLNLHSIIHTLLVDSVRWRHVLQKLQFILHEYDSGLLIKMPAIYKIAFITPPLYFISLSQEDYSPFFSFFFFKLRYSHNSQVKSTRKWFQFVDKYSH